MLAANGFAPTISRNQPHQPGKDEVSAILDATGGRLDGSARDVWFHLQA